MIYSIKFISYIEKLSKGVCDDAQNEEIGGNPDAIEYFTALVCGEPLPEFSDDGGDDDEGPSLEALCYLYNYERFAHHEAGPDDGDVSMIFPGFQFDDDTEDGNDVCVMTEEGEEVDAKNGIPCDCTNPREFMKNMLNKGMFLYILKSPD